MKKLPAELTEKLCKYCNTVKPISDFAKRTTGRCRVCHSALTRDWYARNKDRHKALRDNWRAENSDVNRAYNKAYRDSHKPERTAYQKQRALEDPVGAIAKTVISTAKERAKSRNAKYMSDPLNKQAQDSLGLARLRAPVSLTPSDIRKLWLKQNGLCALSGLPMVRGKGRGNHGPMSPTLDRIHHDGPYENGNVRFVCFAVNSGRGRQTDEQFIALCRAIVNFADHTPST